MVLSFDFTENATRGQIFDTLFNAMDEAQHKRFYEIIERAEVPEKHHHNIGEINRTIDELDAPDQVKDDLRSVYAILAAAEAKVHGCDVSQTHFHEVGRRVASATRWLSAPNSTCLPLKRLWLPPFSPAKAKSNALMVCFRCPRPQLPLS